MKMKSCLAASLMFVFFTGVQLHAHAQQTAGGQESFEVIKTKAENGDADAQLNLGLYYAHDKGGANKGGAKDMTEAVKWYRKAAEQNNAKAQFELGFCYSDGQGVKKSPDEAVKWYRKSALQGNAFAQGSLGAMYFDGADVKRDYYEAFKWFRKAAEQGIDYAQLYLGCIYSKGMGATEKDDVQAAKWLTRAAKQGNSQAQGVLGECYLNGEGVAQDYIEAYKWFNLSAAHKDLQNTQGISAQERSSLIQLMTSAQIAEGQRRAAAFVPRKEIPGLSSDNSNPPETSMGSGTGFFITDDGYLISNYHVVKDAAKVRLVTSAGTIDAKVVQVDAANDLALLKTDGKFSPLPIAASRSAHLGGTVVTIGFPDPSLQGFSPKLAKGEIASLSGAGDDPRYFQISVPVQPGNSGGALVDEHGNVIGIVSAKLDASAALAASGQLPENVNYAVKSSLLLSFLESAPDVASKLKEPNTKDEKFEDVVKSAQDAAVLVLVY